MKWLLILSILFSMSSLSLYSNPSQNRVEIEKIDAEIAQLEEMKRGYEARALRHDDMATYLQFDTQAVLETRRHLQLAEENRNKAALVQEQIDRLKAKKAALQS